MKSVNSGGNAIPSVLLFKSSAVAINGEKAGTLDASYYKGCGMRGGIEREVVAFACNHRDEVRNLNNCAASLQARPGMKQQTFCLQGNIIDRSDTAGANGKGVTEDVAYTLNTIDRHAVCCQDLVSKQYAVDFGRTADRIQMKADTAVTLQGEGGGSGAKTGLYCLPIYSLDRAAYNQGQNAQFGISIQEDDMAQTVISKGPGAVAYCVGNGQADQTKLNKKVGALNCMHDQQALMIAGLDCRNGKENGDMCGTLQAKPNGGFSHNCIHPVRLGYKIRRLTPTECARLQGFPDWWCADVPHSDTAEYKMWGNGVALPCVEFIMQNIKKALDAGGGRGSES